MSTRGSVDDKQLRTDGSVRAMRLGVIRNLVAHSWLEREGSPIGELRVQLAFDAQEVALDGHGRRPKTGPAASRAKLASRNWCCHITAAWLSHGG